MLKKKLINKENAFDQVSFCVSFMRDIDYNMNEYVRLVKNISPQLNRAFSNVNFDNIRIFDESSKLIWALHSEQKLIRKLQKIEF